MSAAAAPAAARTTSSRRFLRYQATLPLNITVLRSGVPDDIPARMLNIGEGGLAAVLAGELRPAQTVGIEFRLFDKGLPIRARALVRHQAELCCGLEFAGLSLDEREMIRRWLEREAEVLPAPPPALPAVSARPLTKPEQETVERVPGVPEEPAKLRRANAHVKMWIGIFAAALALGMLSWWQWQRGWDDLEQNVPTQRRAETGDRQRISPEEMQALLVHKVDPELPGGIKAEGTVTLEAVIGRDGTVIDLRPIAGPEPLRQAAIDAVRWWRFEPYLVHGEAAEVETPVSVVFRP
jgi:hypothetical protein